MQIPEFAKKPPVIIGGIIVFIIILLVARKGQPSASSPNNAYANNVAAANMQIAQLNVDLQRAQLTAANDALAIQSGERVTLARYTTEENVALQTGSYAHDIANRQLENQRVLGLTKEDTTRLLSTQENQTRLTLGVTELDTARFLGERAIASSEVQQARELQFRESQLASNERVQDFTSSRYLTYAQIQGRNQVDAANAARPKWYERLAGGLGTGLGTALGGLIP